MDNKIVGLLIVLSVGVIMVGSLLAPIISDYGDEYKTYYNDGVHYATVDGEEHELVVALDSSGDISITADGEDAEVPDFTLYGSATIVYGNDGLVRLSSAGLIRAFDSTGMAVNYDLSNGDSATITVSDTGVSVVYGEDTDSATFTTSAYICADGDYVLSSNPCVSEDSVIIAGVTNYSTDYIVFTAYGSIDDLTAAAPYAYIDGATATVTSVSATVNTTEVNTNLYQIDSVVFTAEISDEDYTGTYTYFLAPYEVSYENTTYLGSATSGMLAAIVVMFLVALIVIVAKTINRDD